VVTAEAYAVCQRLARSHYENFPVASALVPARMRPHIAAVYAFARTADDFADEGEATPSERLARLDAWEARLDAPPGDDPVFVAVHDTIDVCRLDPQLFRDLLSAFRQDVTTSRYATWADLLDYCHRSANPVGRLVLGIAGRRDETLARQSDAVCTALQLVNFWQDIERDLAKNRIYVPRELWGDAREDDLWRGAFTPAWRAALVSCASRTRALFDDGRPVANGVSGRLRWELRATWLGGVRMLDRLEAQGFDVFGRRPALGFRDLPGMLWDMVTWA
jgi:squalene synthase HpnC